jgi:hypothetical protein
VDKGRGHASGIVLPSPGIGSASRDLRITCSACASLASSEFLFGHDHGREKTHTSGSGVRRCPLSRAFSLASGLQKEVKCAR